MGRPLIRFEGVSKRFGKLTAVDDVTLTVEEGEFFALLGPSRSEEHTSELQAPATHRVLQAVRGGRQGPGPADSQGSGVARREFLFRAGEEPALAPTTTRATQRTRGAGARSAKVKAPLR